MQIPMLGIQPECGTARGLVDILMELAIACDLVLAAEGVRLGIPEAAWSLLAVGAALANLPKLVGEKAALEQERVMVGDMTGERLLQQAGSRGVHCSWLSTKV